MRITSTLAVVTISLLVVQSALAQGSLLGQVEQGLPGGAAAANGYLGAELEDEGQMGKGVLVTRIRPGTPAEKGGLKAGDLITSVDGKPVANLDDYDAVAKKPAGATISMSVVRNGATQQLPVTLGTRPAAPPVTDASTDTTPGTPTPSTGGSPPAGSPPGPTPSLLPATGGTSPAAPGSTDIAPRSGGIIATPQTPAAPSGGIPGTGAPAPSVGDLPGPGGAASGGGASLGVRLPPPGQSAGRAQRGALIASINPGSPAEQAGLKAGQTIVAVDGRQIDSDDDLIAAIKARQPGQSVELSYRDGAEVRRANVRLAQAGAPATGSVPPRTGGSVLPSLPGAGGGPGRSILDRVERIADNLAPGALSTVYNPQAFAELQNRVNALEARLKAIEAKMGIAAPGGGSPGGSLTPGFGTTGSATTPGFGPVP